MYSIKDVELLLVIMQDSWFNDIYFDHAFLSNISIYAE